LESGALQLHQVGEADYARTRELMHKYADRPMDLADAALVRVAERERIFTVFTVDRSDFEVYRPLGRRFRIVP
jgi:predicted nucleic acid-binding protein